MGASIVPVGSAVSAVAAQAVTTKISGERHARAATIGDPALPTPRPTGADQKASWRRERFDFVRLTPVELPTGKDHQ